MKDDFDLRYPTDRKVSKRTERMHILERERQEKMRLRYGSGPEGATCGNCVHLVDHGYYKCELYRISASEATDWRKKWPACGAFKQKGL